MLEEIMNLLLLLNASWKHSGNTPKDFLGAFIFPLRGKMDEMRFRTKFLLIYVIYQTKSIALHIQVD